MLNLLTETLNCAKSWYPNPSLISKYFIYQKPQRANRSELE